MADRGVADEPLFYFAFEPGEHDAGAGGGARDDGRVERAVASGGGAGDWELVSIFAAKPGQRSRDSGGNLRCGGGLSGIWGLNPVGGLAGSLRHLRVGDGWV